MTRTTPAPQTPSLLIAALLALVSSGAARPVAAQFNPPGADQQRPGWPAIEVGARVGYDNGQRAQVVGTTLRVPVLPGAQVELLPSAEVTFLRNLKEYQYNLEAVYLSAGRRGGLYVGGGVGVRDTVLPTNPGAGRTKLSSYSFVAGAKFPAFDRANVLLEFRRIFVTDMVVDPQQVTLGISFELW